MAFHCYFREGVHKFCKTLGAPLEILGSRRAISRKFLVEGPKILGAIVQNVIAVATCVPYLCTPVLEILFESSVLLVCQQILYCLLQEEMCLVIWS